MASSVELAALAGDAGADDDGAPAPTPMLRSPDEGGADGDDGDGDGDGGDVGGDAGEGAAAATPRRRGVQLEKLRHAAAELRGRLDQLRPESLSSQGLADLKLTVVKRLESAEPAVRARSLELIALVGASLEKAGAATAATAAATAAAGRAAGHSAREYITDHFSRAAADGGISLAERAGLALDMDGTTDAAAAAAAYPLAGIAAVAPGTAAHAMRLPWGAERMAELGHPDEEIYESALLRDAEEDGDGDGGDDGAAAAAAEAAAAAWSAAAAAEGRVHMFGMPRDSLRPRCCVRLKEGAWSDGFHLGSLTTGGVVALPAARGGAAGGAASGGGGGGAGGESLDLQLVEAEGSASAEDSAGAAASAVVAAAAAAGAAGHGGPAAFELGVSSAMASGRYWRTRLVTFTHRFMLSNACGRALLLRQVGGGAPSGGGGGAAAAAAPVLLLPGGRCAWHWPHHNAATKECRSSPPA